MVTMTRIGNSYTANNNKGNRTGYTEDVWNGVSEKERKKIERILINYRDFEDCRYTVPLEQEDFTPVCVDKVPLSSLFQEFRFFDEEEHKIQWEIPRYSEADLRDLLYHLLTLEPEAFSMFRNYLLNRVPVNRAIHFSTNRFIGAFYNNQRKGYGNIRFATKSWEKALKTHLNGNRSDEVKTCTEKSASQVRNIYSTNESNYSAIPDTDDIQHSGEPHDTIYNDMHCLRRLPNSHPKDAIQFFRRIPNSLMKIAGERERMNINFSLKTHNVEVAKQLRDIIVPLTDRLFTELESLNTWTERKSRIMEFKTAMQKNIKDCVEMRRKTGEYLNLEKAISQEHVTHLANLRIKSHEQLKTEKIRLQSMITEKRKAANRQIKQFTRKVARIQNIMAGL